MSTPSCSATSAISANVDQLDRIAAPVAGAGRNTPAGLINQHRRGSAIGLNHVTTQRYAALFRAAVPGPNLRPAQQRPQAPD